ncbi:MAG: CPCC family cysteine-rich protein [Phycisphaerales bacterium]
MESWPKNANGGYACPCCGYHTLGCCPPNSFDTCQVCLWGEDCGLELWSGANGGTDLAEARRNFERHGDIFEPSPDDEARTKVNQSRITDYLLPRHDWAGRIDKTSW